MDVIADLQAQRVKIRKNHESKKGEKKEDGITVLDKLIANYNDSLEEAKDQFPGYEFPVTLQIDIDWRDPQYKYHSKLVSTLREKFRKTGYFKPKYTVERNQELERTVQRLIARNRV